MVTNDYVIIIALILGAFALYKFYKLAKAQNDRTVEELKEYESKNEPIEQKQQKINKIEMMRIRKYNPFSNGFKSDLSYPCYIAQLHQNENNLYYISIWLDNENNVLIEAEKSIEYIIRVYEWNYINCRVPLYIPYDINISLYKPHIECLEKKGDKYSPKFAKNIDNNRD